MTWGVNIKNVYLSRLRKAELREYFNENEAGIRGAAAMLLMLAAATPRDRKDESWEEYVQAEVESCIEDIKLAAGQNFVISQALEDMDDVEDDPEVE